VNNTILDLEQDIWTFSKFNFFFYFGNYFSVLTTWSIALRGYYQENNYINRYRVKSSNLNEQINRLWNLN